MNFKSAFQGWEGKFNIGGLHNSDDFEPFKWPIYPPRKPFSITSSCLVCITSCCDNFLVCMCYFHCLKSHHIFSCCVWYPHSFDLPFPCQIWLPPTPPADDEEDLYVDLVLDMAFDTSTTMSTMLLATIAPYR